MINIEDFKKLEIKIGEILKVDQVENSAKLLKLTVDFKEENPRTILSGIASYFPNTNQLVGIKCAFATNLEPRELMGMTSQGMILATSGENFFSLLKVDPEVPAGSTIK
jgi:methionyl-tRNA synthetase